MRWDWLVEDDWGKKGRGGGWCFRFGWELWRDGEGDLLVDIIQRLDIEQYSRRVFRFQANNWVSDRKNRNVSVNLSRFRMGSGKTTGEINETGGGLTFATLEVTFDFGSRFNWISWWAIEGDMISLLRWLIDWFVDIVSEWLLNEWLCDLWYIFPTHLPPRRCPPACRSPIAAIPPKKRRDIQYSPARRCLNPRFVLRSATILHPRMKWISRYDMIYLGPSIRNAWHLFFPFGLVSDFLFLIRQANSSSRVHRKASLHMSIRVDQPQAIAATSTSPSPSPPPSSSPPQVTVTPYSTPSPQHPPFPSPPFSSIPNLQLLCIHSETWWLDRSPWVILDVYLEAWLGSSMRSVHHRRINYQHWSTCILQRAMKTSKAIRLYASSLKQTPLTINFDNVPNLPLNESVLNGFPKLNPTVAYPETTSNKMLKMDNQDAFAEFVSWSRSMIQMRRVARMTGQRSNLIRKEDWVQRVWGKIPFWWWMGWMWREGKLTRFAEECDPWCVDWWIRIWLDVRRTQHHLTDGRLKGRVLIVNTTRYKHTRNGLIDRWSHWPRSS